MAFPMSSRKLVIKTETEIVMDYQDVIIILEITLLLVTKLQPIYLLGPTSYPDPLFPLQALSQFFSEQTLRLACLRVLVPPRTTSPAP